MDPDYIEELLIMIRAEDDAETARMRRETAKRKRDTKRRGAGGRPGMVVEDVDVAEII